MRENMVAAAAASLENQDTGARFIQSRPGIAGAGAEVDRDGARARERQVDPDAGSLGGSGEGPGHAGRPSDPRTREDLPAAVQAERLPDNAQGSAGATHGLRFDPRFRRVDGSGRAARSEYQRAVTPDQRHAVHGAADESGVQDPQDLPGEGVEPAERATARAASPGRCAGGRPDAAGGGGAHSGLGEIHVFGDHHSRGTQPAGAADDGSDRQQGAEAGAHGNRGVAHRRSSDREVSGVDGGGTEPAGRNHSRRYFRKAGR